MNFRRAFFFANLTLYCIFIVFFWGGRSSEYIPSVCMMMMMKMKLLQMEVLSRSLFLFLKKLLRANGDDIDDLP